jgi:pyruvate/2-oxoglutarate dehydrogenase complex dihydrolipoamide dehydrogenase (E3) component
MSTAPRDMATLSHNDRLLEAVRPPQWVNPNPRDRYHLVVIGAGTAGLVTAAGAAGLGARVALIERHLMGGDCLNVGCVPSKGLIAPARAWAAARSAAALMHGPAVQGDGDGAGVFDRMRRLRADIAPVDGAERFRALGVDVFLGEGRFEGRDAIRVGTASLRFRRAVIATGARAKAPPIPGLADVPYLTNETLFDLARVPSSLIVLGGGPIGCEMAQTFARLGCRVTLLDKGPRLLPRDDADASAVVRRALERDGVRVCTNADIRRVRPAPTDRIAVEAVVDGTPVVADGDQLLVAIGRVPNIEGLGLDEAGIRTTAQGIVVDDRLRTTNTRVFACGDVASRFQFTHAADFQARTVIQNALFFGRKRASALVVPWATYTSPEVAQVGHTSESATAAGVAIETYTVPMHDVDRAILDGESEGFARVHVAAGTDRIVGATIVAPHASDLLHEVTLAMTHGLGLGAIGATIHPYPTHGDAVRKCADQWRRTRLTPRVRAAFSTWFRFFA